MKPYFLIGNWKSNIQLSEAMQWFQIFHDTFFKHSMINEILLVLCVPFTLLAPAREFLAKYNTPIQLGAQDISPFGKGAYTGEINADMIKEFASYVLVGHSERRRYFHETKEELEFEILQAKTSDLTVIYCVSSEKDDIPQSIDVVAYEPVGAIGTGKPEDPEVAGRVCRKLKEKTGKPVLYGGSVSLDSIDGLLKKDAIDGFLIGKASLDPEQFFKLYKHIAAYSA